uniref:Sulfhydryl oxidase n=1 Tax=Aceria tosichella TaxID=561515 RepID=A0A6G1S6U4_9ACAR
MKPITTNSSRHHTTLCLLFITTTALASFVAVQGDRRDLYTSKDAVLRLNSETFKSTVFNDNKDVTFLVQFYNKFCGHCQHFAPTYKQLASKVQNWTSVVRVAGIDCSNDENIPVCSENKIDGYPTLLLFPPNAHFNDPNDAPLNLRSLNIEWNEDDLLETIITYIGNLTATNRHYPLAVDALQPIKHDHISAVKRLYPFNTGQNAVDVHTGPQDLMFIVESEQSYLGRKLILEYFRISSKLELRRILLSNKALLKSLLTKEEYMKLENSQPLLLKLDGHDSSSRVQILVRGEAKHILPTLHETERQDFIYNRFKTFFEQFYYEELKEAGGYSEVHVATPKQPILFDVSSKTHKNDELDIHYLVHSDPVSSKKVFAVDLLKGISYLMTHEVRVKGDLSPSEFTTIRNLLTTFRKYLPLDKWDPSMGKFISDMRTRLDEKRWQYERDGITAQQMNDVLEFSGSHAVKSRYDREHWVSCSESDRQQKGYPCSLWLLFHTLTVGEYTKAAPVRSRPTLVLTTMRDYITKFFGCTVCSSNFEKETKNLEDSLKHRNSSVLWLWNTHNFVNQRLNNERPRDKIKPLVDVIYPRHPRCPECYKTDVKDIGTDGKTLDDIEWSLTSVLEFLTATFRADKIVSPVEMASLLASLKGKVNYDLIQSDLANEHLSADADSKSERSEWNFFSASDMGICLFLYLFCLVVKAFVTQ